MAGRRKKTTEAAPVETPAPTRGAVIDLNSLFKDSLEPGTVLVAPSKSDGVFQLVESNIKGGVRTELGPCTAIVSKSNRAGKTSVLDSFRFALTGTHPIGPHASDLAGLTKDGSFPTASIQGVGTNCSARFPKGKKTVDHHVVGPLADLTDEQRKGLLPLSSTRDLLTLGSAKAREELFRRFGDAETQNPKPRGLDSQQEALFQRAYNSSAGDVVERLAAAGTWLRSHKRALSERLKALEEEKSRLFGEASEGGAVTDDLIAALEAKLEQWSAYKRGSTLRENLTRSESDLNAAVDQLSSYGAVETPESFDQRMSQAQAVSPSAAATEKLLKLRDELDQASKRLRLLETILTLRKALDGQAQHPCHVCAEPFHGSSYELVEAAERAVAEEKSRLAGQTLAVEQAKENYLELERQWAAFYVEEKRKYDTASNGYNMAKAKVAALAHTYKLALGAVENAGALTAPDESEESLRARLDQAKLSLAHSDRGEEVSAAIRTLKDEQGDCKAVEVVLEHTLTKLLEGVKDKAEAAVNSWMPAGFKASLCLESDDGKPECRWEVVGVDGQPHRKGALSGAEWAALSVAIACAWTEGQPYRYLLLDDTDIAGFSAENVANILHTLSAAVKADRLTQVLVAWSRPQEIPSEGWTVVEL